MQSSTSTLYAVSRAVHTCLSGSCIRREKKKFIVSILYFVSIFTFYSGKRNVVNYKFDSSFDKIYLTYVTHTCSAQTIFAPSFYFPTCMHVLLQLVTVIVSAYPFIEVNRSTTKKIVTLPSVYSCQEKKNDFTTLSIYRPSILSCWCGQRL